MSEGIKTLTTTAISKLFCLGFSSGGHEIIYAATQGQWVKLWKGIYFLKRKHSYQAFQDTAKRAFKERDHFATIAQQQADLNFLCAEYMKRRGLPPQAFRNWLGSKEAKRLMLAETERRKRLGEKK